MGGGNGSGHGSGDGAGAYKNKEERIMVPAMPYPMAIICCVLNFLIPGFGTMVAGFSVFWCARNEDMAMSDKFLSCLTNFGIGFLQLSTFLFCLIGWIWSCVWGVFFIGTSADNYHGNKVEDQDGRPGHVVQNQPPSEVIITSVAGPTTAVMTQPYPMGSSTVNQPLGPGFNIKY